MRSSRPVHLATLGHAVSQPLTWPEINRFDSPPASLDEALLAGAYPRVFERDVRRLANVGVGLRYTDFVAKLPEISTCSEAESYAAAWRRAGPELDAKRLQKLRDLSEEDSARCFAELLRPIGELPLRSSSGLVEQQRIFARMRGKRR